MDTIETDGLKDHTITVTATGEANSTSVDGLSGHGGKVQHAHQQNKLQIDFTPSWQQKIWVFSSMSLLMTILILCSIAMFTLAKMIYLLQGQNNDHLFQFAGMNLVSNSLLRLMAILIGGAISFVGMAVSFFAHKKAISLNADVAKEEIGSAKAALATHSPGIVAVIIGALIIVAAMFARAKHDYRPPTISYPNTESNGLSSLPSIDSVLTSKTAKDSEERGNEEKPSN